MLKKFIFAFVIFSLLICSFTFASTKEDLISAINKTYTVGEESYRLPQKIITKAENYLNKNPLTPEQYDSILRCIDKAVALAREKGTTDISKFSKEEIIEMLNILVEASSLANVDFEKELAEIGMEVPITPAPDNVVKEEKNKEIKETNQPEKSDNGNSNDKEVIPNSSSKEESEKQQEEPKEIISEESNVSGEIDKNDFKSGESETINSGEILPNINVSEIISNDKNVDIIIEKNIKIFISILVVFFIIIILLFCLILRAKWNKIAKWILIIIFVLLIITTFVVLVLIANYIEEIKLIYKLYYIFK